MSRISQSDDESTNSPMYIAGFFSFYKNCIINVYCVTFFLFQNEKKNLHNSCYILCCVFKNKKKENVFKTIISRVVFPMQAYSVCFFPFFVLQKMIAMFSRIFMVNGFFFFFFFFLVINVLLRSTKYQIHQFWLNQTFRILF